MFLLVVDRGPLPPLKSMRTQEREFHHNKNEAYCFFAQLLEVFPYNAARYWNKTFFGHF